MHIYLFTKIYTYFYYYSIFFSFHYFPKEKTTQPMTDEFKKTSKRKKNKQSIACAEKRNKKCAW